VSESQSSSSGGLSDALAEAVDRLAPISLDALDARAALRRRADAKYVIAQGSLTAMIDRVAERYEVLEIDGLRAFSYESVYFDTPGLLSFHEHVEGVRPRFKSRSRLYQETGVCFFEVKVKNESDTTVKRQCDYDLGDHGRLTDEVWAFLDASLHELADRTAPPDLAPSLATRYRRITLGARDHGERVTIDLEVVLQSMEDNRMTMPDDMALVETKTEGGEGAVDDELAALGCQPATISKYRLGVGLLLPDDPEAARPSELRGCFT
jgi:hypothetical protein